MPAERIDEQYRQHLESEQDDGGNCAVQHSQTLSLSQKLVHRITARSIDWDPYVDTTVVVTYMHCEAS